MTGIGSPPRRTLTALDKAKVLARYAVCPRCGEPLGSLDVTDFDHVGQLSMTADNSLENFRPLHRLECHPRKTAEDARDRAKTKRLTADHEAARRRMLAKDAGEPKPRSKWGSRPFPKRRKVMK